MFKGILITRDESGYQAAVRQIDDAVLSEGDVTVRVEWSTLNYKDGLALTGKAPVVRRFPMVPGIDFAGTVRTSSNPAWKAGDRVLLNGWGVGETHCGGLAEVARVRGEWLVPLPAAFTARQAMAIGTAGYTAMLCVLTLYGIDSVMAPLAVRQEAWARLARDLDIAKLDAITTEIGLSEAVAMGASLLDGKVRGRVVVDVNR